MTNAPDTTRHTAEPVAMPLRQAAERFGFARRTLNAAIARGELRAINVGAPDAMRPTFYLRARDLELWMSQRMTA